MTYMGSGDFVIGEQGMKTTKKQFEHFKKCFLIYAEKWGLKEWRFDFAHDDCGHALSTVNYDTLNKVVTVAFTTEFGSLPPLTMKEVRETAKHEVHEMVVAELSVLAHARFTTEDEIVRVRHTLVRRMDNVVK